PGLFMKRGRPPRLILPPDPFSVANSEKEPTWPGGIQTVLPTEQDSLREKGMRKNLDWASPWLHE
ncbi:MAG: hypothetical protein AB8B97_24850, partial [Granulosicoccus sp.]